MIIKRMTFTFATLAIIYGVIMALMAYFQRSLMYFPDRNIAAPQHYGLREFEDRRIQTQDGMNIQLWYKPAHENFPTIVYFHGNAANLGNRAGIYHALAQHGFGIAALSYRGYGASEGRPSESGLYTDARATIDFLLQQHIPPARTILYGESLGTGVAVQMATEYNVAGLVLQAAYTSTVTRAAEIYPWLPVRLVMLDRFDSLSKIDRVKAPLLMLHGEQDATIPIAHGRRVFAAATEPKQFIAFPQVQHNDFDSNEISEHVSNFARQYHLITAP